MSYSMEVNIENTPPTVKFQIGEEFTGDDFDQWLVDYDQVMSAQTTTTNVLVDTSQNKKVHNAIRRMFSKMDFPEKYPNLGWTVIWGDSRIIATTVQFVSIANKSLKIKYTQTEEEAMGFLENPKNS